MSKQNIKIAFRTNGNKQIGLGHIYRCIAVAEMLKAHFDCFFIVTDIHDVENIIPHEFRIFQLPKIQLLEEASWLSSNAINYDIIVLDGYYFNYEYQKQIKKNEKKLVCIDDIHAIRFCADMIINHSNMVSEENYILDGGTLLLGTNYAMLRPVFLRAAKERRSINKLKNVAICFGGADPQNLTAIILKLIKDLYFDKIDVIIGNSYCHQDKLKSQLDINKRKDIYIHKSLNEDEILSLLKKNDLLICPPSNISMEACAVKIPMAIIQVADNQKYMKKYLIDNQCAVEINKLNKDSLLQAINRINITQMIHNQSKVIDGHSGERILSAFLNLAS